MRYRGVIACAVLAACGRLRFDAVGAGTGSGSTTMDGTGSAVPDAAPFTPSHFSYIKASNTDTFDNFGTALALSADGATLAVSSVQEASAATTINGNQSDNSAASAGAVYVFVRAGASWAQQAYIKASNAEAFDSFGTSLAISADGNTIAVGATGEASLATGIGGNQGDNTASAAGAVYVLTRNGATWSQQAYIKASNTDASDAFGTTVSLAADGSTLAVGAPGEDSAATTINGNGADDSGVNSGAVYVFTRAGTTWSQQAYVKASNNTGADDAFGTYAALSSDGNTLVVGSPKEDGLATDSGAAYVYTRSGTTWTEQAYLKASNAGSGDAYGTRLALSGDGQTLAVGALDEWSAATGINGDQSDNSSRFTGAVYTLTRAGATWTQDTYIKASNAQTNDFFSASVALSTDGAWLAVGASGEASNATGLDGNQADNSSMNSGAVYLFARTGTSWAQSAYLKAPNTGTNDRFSHVAWSADGSTLVVGATDENSNATGIDGNQADNSMDNAGAVYAYF